MDSLTLARSLAGVFNNRPQALESPAWFVQLRLWICPVAALSGQGQVTYFLEQASATYPQAPYRQRILQLRVEPLEASYFALTEPLAWQGAAQERDRLQHLTTAHLIPLAGSTLPLVPHPGDPLPYYQARHRPGERCTFPVQAEAHWVELAFDLRPAQPPQRPQDEFWMGDRGYDPATATYTWGARHGPFQLQKEQDWGAQIQPSWLA